MSCASRTYISTIGTIIL